MRPVNFCKWLCTRLAVTVGCLGIILFCWDGYRVHELQAETVNNNITLTITKVSDAQYKLDWVDPTPTPPVYRIYRSEDPAVLGNQIAKVNAFTYTDNVADPNIPVVYYYQIVRANE